MHRSDIWYILLKFHSVFRVLTAFHLQGTRRRYCSPEAHLLPGATSPLPMPPMLRLLILQIFLLPPWVRHDDRSQSHWGVRHNDMKLVPSPVLLHLSSLYFSSLLEIYRTNHYCKSRYERDCFSFAGQKERIYNLQLTISATLAFMAATSACSR